LMINSVIGFLLVAIAGLFMPSIREKIIPFVEAEAVNQPTRSGLSTKV
jgi:hypothetical protein